MLFTRGVIVDVGVRAIVALGKVEESRQLGVESTFPYGLRVFPC